MPTLPFQVTTGPVEVGLCDFTVRLGESSWSCRASYISTLPVTELIHSAIDLYEHLFEDPFPLENAVWDTRSDGNALWHFPGCPLKFLQTEQVGPRELGQLLASIR